MQRPYRSVDHIVLRLLAAEPLYGLLSDTLGLPVAWPRQREAFGTYGWVHLGNTDLELWAASSNSDLSSHAPAPLIHGFALEPTATLRESLSWMDEAQLAVRAPRAFRSQTTAGEWVTNFTNAVLPDVSSPSCCVFFCEWDRCATIYPWDAAETPVVRRAQLREALAQRRGGALGITGLQSIQLGTPHLELTRRHWRTLTGSTGRDAIALTSDIALELIPAQHLAIESICLGVRSLAQARSALRELHLLQEDLGSSLYLAAQGLQIQLKEALPGSC